MNTNVLMAVFRRNFVSYFANPTGYVFICLFVFFGAIAAFWVPDFFNNNLANLDQLSFWLPFIMLVYIPSITMGIWAEERKQGTDELLLTIPAGDFDIVLGKYLAAVGIYTVSLLFSLVCNYMVLNNLASDNAFIALLPRLDLGLFLGTYVGYWLIGLAMLAIGMVASFLTGNITIGFVLGVLLNMPLVFLSSIDVIFGTIGKQSVTTIQGWSLAKRFADFSHGVLTLSGVMYFAMIAVLMLYISMVLIGRRHWFSSNLRWVQAGHYAARTLALAVIALALVLAIQNHDVRIDASSERLSSLSPETVSLIRSLNVERPVQVEAFISPNVPESYVQTRMNLLSVLRELQAIGGNRLQVQIHDTERYSSEAALADKRFGIEPRQVASLNRGAVATDYIFLNVKVSCGVRDVPAIFIDRGIPIEYELVRSICTVSEQKRKKVGVLNTDAQLYGSFNMQTMSPGANWPIVDELEKQYEVVRVDPTKPITEKFDVLLAVQPSSLGPQEMDNFISAVKNGQPTVVFEDPAPVLSSAPATSMPRQAPGGMNAMFMGQQAPPKGEISKLWDLLGIEFPTDMVVWQNYNPYPRASSFPREFVFIDSGCGAKKPFGEGDPISVGLQQLLLPFSGAMSKLNTSTLDFVPLAETGDRTGDVRFSEIVRMTPFGPRGGLNPDRRQRPTGAVYVVAAHISGKIKPESEKAEKPQDGDKAKSKDEGKKGEKAAKPAEPNINVVVVCDIDMLSQDFFRLREQGNMPESGVDFNFDNVTFVLNALDSLAGDERFIEIRKRRPKHRLLMRIEERTKDAKQQAVEAREKFVKDLKAEDEKLGQEILDVIEDMKKNKDMDPQQLQIQVSMKMQDLERQRTAKIEQSRRTMDRNINKIETDLALTVKSVQGQYKIWAVLLPPIPPLLVAIVVYFTRRSREREGVSKSRLR